MPHVLAALLTVAVPAAVASEIVVPVPVQVDAAIPAETLQEALTEVDTIFRDGGIRLAWSLEPAPPLQPAVVTVNVVPRPARLVVYGCSRDLHDHRLGNTRLGTKHITLWTEQVARAVSGDWDGKKPSRVDDRLFARALGRVLAHELGHLFLRLYGHRPDGLMRKAFSHRSLTSRSNERFRFSNLDLDRLRASLERYSKPARNAPDS